MKSKKSLLIIALLTIFTFCTVANVHAVDYTLGIDVGDVFIMEVTAIDEDYASNLEKGDKSKIKIDAIEETSTSWKITFEIWDFTSGSFSDTGSKSTYSLLKAPSASSPALAFVCPIPVETYLSEVYGDSAYSTSVDLTYKGTGIEISYNPDTGFVILMNILIKYDVKVRIEVTREYAIPGYELSIFLGVAAVSTIGLIYVIMKKK